MEEGWVAVGSESRHLLNFQLIFRRQVKSQIDGHVPTTVRLSNAFHPRAYYPHRTYGTLRKVFGYARARSLDVTPAPSIKMHISGLLYRRSIRFVLCTDAKARGFFGFEASSTSSSSSTMLRGFRICSHMHMCTSISPHSIRPKLCWRTQREAKSAHEKMCF